MAHEFIIITTSNETVVYTDYDAIDLTTLKHVISFIPDLGTLLPSNEILLETGTIDATATQGIMMETVNLVTVEGTTYSVSIEDKLLLEDDGQVMCEAASVDALAKLLREDWISVPNSYPATESENHLVLETADDSTLNTNNHYHPPMSGPHLADEGAGHTEAEHRDMALWALRLKLLMVSERANA